MNRERFRTWWEKRMPELRPLLHHPICFTVASCVWWELLFHIFETGGARWVWPPLCAALAHGLLGGLIVTAFAKPRASFGVCCGLTAVGWMVACSQVVYHRIFETFYTTFSLVHGAAALRDFYREALAGIGRNLWLLLLLGAPLWYLLLRGRKVLRFGRSGKLWKTAAAFGIACALFVLSLLPYGTAQFSPVDLMLRSSNLDYAAQRLGFAVMMEVDAGRFVTGWTPDEEAGSIEMAAPELLPSETEPPAETDGAGPADGEAPADGPDAEEPAESAPAPVVYGDNVLDIDFAALAENETDKTLQKMHRYFAAQKPTRQNEMTGLFEGCNLVMMTCEGFSQYVIDEQRTPTLYKMSHEGICFTEFYTPIWSVSTSDGEYVACQGLLPKDGEWSFRRSSKNYLPFVMGNELSAIGYPTYAYHNHTYTYYARDRSHPNMGYDYKGVGNGLVLPHKSWPNSDVEMIEATADEYIHETPFHAYYMTVSGHLNYTFMGNQQAYNHRDEMRELPYPEAIQAYFACQQELENALTLLCEKLDAVGQLENTVFVLSADHYPYGLTDEELSILAGHEIDPVFEKYRNACIIYKKGMTPVVVDEPCCSLDILPTVLNLFGLPYDSRLLMGRDIFSGAEPFVVFKDRSWITGHARYNNQEKTLVPTEDVILPQDYRTYWSAVASDKFTYSARILEQDYFRLVVGEPAGE